MELKKSDFDKLVEQGLVSVKFNKGLFIYKYKNKVFYKNLWDSNPLLKECRGVVFKPSGECVIRPFHKVYNVGENGTQPSTGKKYMLHSKINGFMAAATIVDGELVVSTTGSLDSPFTQLAEAYLERFRDVYKELVSEYGSNKTFLYEICDRSDPHIVPETEGVYLIGIRDVATGRYENIPEFYETRIMEGLPIPTDNMPRFFITQGSKFETIKKQAKNEGFMVVDIETNEPVMKLKTAHYLTKKFIMRMGGSNIEKMFDDPELFKHYVDEEFYCVVDYITQNFIEDRWKSFHDQERRTTIEYYFMEVENGENSVFGKGSSGSGQNNTGIILSSKG